MELLSRYSDEVMDDIWSEDTRYQIFYDVELAYLEAEAKLGLIPAEVATYMRANRPRYTAAEVRDEERRTRHEVVAFINVVSRRLEKWTEYFHRGLTSSDIMDTCFSLQLKRSLAYLNKLNGALLGSLMEKAEELKNALCAARTHGVHAEPYFFGLRLLSVATAIGRSAEEIRRLEENMPGKLSGAVGVYTNIQPEVEREFLESLGLKQLPITTQVVPRDVYAPILFAVALEGAILEKLAQDMRLLQVTEVGEAQEEFAEGQAGSSAMPHKRNPVRWERICGLSRLLRSQVMVGLENVALWWERDISHSSAERVAYPLALSLLAYMIRETKSLIDRSRFNTDRMLGNLSASHNLIYSSRALGVVQGKLGRIKGYNLVRDVAQRVLEHGGDFLTELQQTGVLSAEELAYVSDLTDLRQKVEIVYDRVRRYLVGQANA
ncbi:adenylosuccinate lyase [Coprothermobacteraceae bacterium]|nr:adenylosuccinate lyase [Coprothermobacteraceae bacterium]